MMKISESFADTKHSSKRRRRKREDFLERMDKLIPWALFVDLASRTVRTAAGAAPRTHPLETIFRGRRLQLLFNPGNRGAQDLP